MRIIPVTTLDLPELEPYRTLRGRTWHWSDDFFVAEGEKAVRALLDARLDVVSLLMSAEWLEQLEAQLSADRFGDTDVYLADDALLERIVGYPLHKKLLAIGRIPPNPPLAALHTREAGRHVHVALEGLADAENMGMILRNAAAFGVRSLIWGPDSTSPWLRRSIRVSLGNLFTLRIHRAENVHTTLCQCREKFAWRIIGTTPRGGSPLIEWKGEEAEHVCLLFGSEAEGLSDEALTLCDAHFTIPMSRGVDSINVANAVAVALYEAMRTASL
ncbi:MAG: RNA methyltransferase [Bacteroidetes bacterium]|nr:RNA methyltransferase [Bacteroidota bacterium]